MTKPSVLISFRNKQKKFVTELSLHLKRNKITPWVEAFTPGKYWRRELLDEIKKTDYCILILSKDYAASQFCRMEAFTAQAYNRKIIPILVDECYEELNKYEETNRISDIFGIHMHTDNLFGLKTSREDKLNRIIEEISTPSHEIEEPHLVYISYLSENADFATSLANNIERSSMSSWVATKNLKLGQNWRTAQAKAMMNAAAHVVVLNSEITNSKILKTEIMLAEAQGINIYTIFPEGFQREQESVSQMVRDLDSNDQTYRKLTERQFYSSSDEQKLIEELAGSIT